MARNRGEDGAILLVAAGRRREARLRRLATEEHSLKEELTKRTERGLRLCSVRDSA